MVESKKRAFIFLLISFVLALVVGYLVYEKVKELNADLGDMTEIYVAKESIRSRVLIQENQITTMEIPVRFLTDSHITDPTMLLDNQVSIVPLNAGDIITKNMIKPVSNLHDEDNRLVAIYRTSNITFDQVVEPLDRIDIIVSMEDAEGEKITEVFMTDIPVIFTQGSGNDFAGAAVEVTIEEASELIHMQNYAEHIRILKANVGRDSNLLEEMDEEVDEDAEDTDATEEETEDEEIEAEETEEEDEAEEQSDEDITDEDEE